MAKYKLNKRELLEHWNDQLSFIKLSAEQYDKGKENEARRIATSLRILFHEGPHSIPLIKQTGLIHNFLLWSSGSIYTPSNLLSSWVLLLLEINASGAYYKPRKLGKGDRDRTFFLKYEDWWNEIIFDDKKNVFTRKDIVRYVANQDGGAHVDMKLDEKYAELVKHNSLGWMDHMGNPVRNNPAYAAIRQIAEELLISQYIFLKGSYTRKKQNNRLFEMRYVDENRRFKWSATDMVYPEETYEIVKQYKKEDRNLYVYEYKDGTKIEVISR